MEMKEKVFYDLSMLSYFDVYETGVSVDTFIQQVLDDEKLDLEYPNDVVLPYHKEALKKITKGTYEDLYIKEFVNDNANSGVVFYIFESKDYEILAFRGSEALDDVHQKTGWQDWTDNFHMFLGNPTYQQLVALHEIQNREFHKPMYFCGHSKGGNLAMYVALTMNKELLKQLACVVSFNAPGITKDILDVYAVRAKDPEFLKKILIIECENDCISSFFENLKTPYYIRSSMPCTNLIQLYHNHQLYAMDFENNQYILAEKKTAIPKLVYHFVNDFFVNLKEERLYRVVNNMDDYFNSSLSLNELYKVMLYHISKYTNIFEDIPYEEIQTITFQDLINRRKSKNLLDKVKDMAVQSLNDFDIKEVTQGLIDNYELLLDSKKNQLQELLNTNNERISNAIHSIRNTRSNKTQEDVEA